VHHPRPLADGNWDVGFGTYLTCDGGQESASVDSWVQDPNNGNTWMGSTEESQCSTWHQPCGTWTMRSEGGMQDVPSGIYNQSATAQVWLKDTPDATGSPPAWVITPPGCIPGSGVADCALEDRIVLPSGPS
jgi:hypothetical protein